MTQKLVLADPGVAFGSFRVLPFAAGGFVVVDERRPVGERTMSAPFTSIDDATNYARVLFELGEAA